MWTRANKSGTLCAKVSVEVVVEAAMEVDVVVVVAIVSFVVIVVVVIVVVVRNSCLLQPKGIYIHIVKRSFLVRKSEKATKIENS